MVLHFSSKSRAKTVTNIRNRMDSWTHIHKYATTCACSGDRLAGSEYRDDDNCIHEIDSGVKNAENIPSMIQKINISYYEINVRFLYNELFG